VVSPSTDPSGGTGAIAEGALLGWQEHLLPGVALDPADLESAGTLLRAWSQRWRSVPDAPLWREGPGRWWSAEEFDAATRRVAGRLVGAGLVAGDRVLWSTSSSVAALVAHVGALRAGLVVVPANVAYSERELTHIVDDARPAAAIVEGAGQAEWVRRASGGGVRVLGADVDLPDAEPGPLDQAGPDDPALVCYTSGTTGAPKGAVLRHRNLLAATESIRIAWRWTPDDRLVHCLPLFHAHGLCVGAYGTMLSGASALLLPHFDPAAVVEEARAGRATLFFGVPTMYHRLLSSGRAAELRSLRLCVSGSAPLSADTQREVSAAVGSSVLERYGMTETLMNTSNPYDGSRRAGTVGFPLPGVQVALADDDEVLVRGPNVFDGYWDCPAANAVAFLPAADGGRPWFRTGDLGAAEDGYLAIRGRSKELIISGGFNVYPLEVEEVVGRHPRIAEVVVTGTPSDEWGEVVTAWIVADGAPPSVDELAVFTASTLAAYKRPRLVRVVDELPRNALGKVVRSQLEP
jgi:malonyl-CoA/methylmalonyl-CoA synthetase